MKSIFETDDSWSSLILRIMMGVVMFPHGAQKLLGWYGGFGYAGTMGFFTETMGLPSIVAFLIIIGESVGSVAMLLGFMTRFTALSFIVIMLGAIWLVHWPDGFFMNWFGKQTGEGFEYHLLVIGICAALTLTGGGRWSVDRAVAMHWNRFRTLSKRLAFQEEN